MKVPMKQTWLVLITVVLLGVVIIQKHLQRVTLSYRISELKKVKQGLEEENRKLEALFSQASTPEILLKRCRLWGMTLKSRTHSLRKANAAPVEGDFDGQ